MDQQAQQNKVLVARQLELTASLESAQRSERETKSQFSALQENLAAETSARKSVEDELAALKKRQIPALQEKISAEAAARKTAEAELENQKKTNSILETEKSSLLCVYFISFFICSATLLR